jgi:YtkA-like protein
LLGAAAVISIAALGKESAPEARPLRSEHGLYELRLARPPADSPVNRLHTWQLRLSDREGDRVKGATIGVDGDMPAHGHGLPTRPIARELGAGRYAVEGMKFQMGGRWHVDFHIDAGGRADTARVVFTLPGG